MNATGTVTFANAATSGSCDRYTVRTGSAVCEVRVRTIAPIADVLGFESEMDVAAEGLIDPAALVGAADGSTVADLLDSRMIAPPRPRRRRQRSVSSRALFYGTSGR